jgi:5-methyltetrahydropteroyltriglutamate--homocysteine methyltransferase
MQYERIFPALAASHIDQVSLECAHSHVPVELLSLLDGKDVLVGAIDVASDKAETPEEVAATIEDALRFVPPERLYPCTNCGMAPLDRTLAKQKLAALAARKSRRQRDRVAQVFRRRHQRMADDAADQAAG